MADDVPASASKWSHFLVLDFEATCAENDPTQKQWSELIEFPAVLIDARTHATVAEFRSMIRPTQRPMLTDFCTKLTSITQDQVNEAPTLPEVLKRFDAWLPSVLGSNDTSGVLPVTCGEPDLSWMLPRECKRKGLAVPGVLQRYCNVKKPFSGLLAVRAGGMVDMLRRLNIPLEGRHHLGIDDARNIARILLRLATLGAEIDVTGGSSSNHTREAQQPAAAPTVQGPYRNCLVQSADVARAEVAHRGPRNAQPASTSSA